MKHIEAQSWNSKLFEEEKIVKIKWSAIQNGTRTKEHFKVDINDHMCNIEISELDSSAAEKYRSTCPA